MRRIWMLACLAAVLTVACGSSGAGEDAPEGEAGDAGTSTTQPATSTTTSPSLDVTWETLDVIGPDMAPPGHFRTADGFVAPFHVAIPETLKYLGSGTFFVNFIPEEEEFTPSEDLDTGVTRAFLVVDMGLGSVEETLEWFESEPTMATTSRASATMGGVEGTTIDVTTAELVTIPDLGYFEPDWIYRATVLDVEGTTITVFVEAHLDVFDEFWDDVQPALQSLTWVPEEYVEVEIPEYEPAPGSIEDGLAFTAELEIPDPAPETPTGPFQAAGTAVEAGWFCAEGTYTQLSYAELDPANAIETWEMQLDCGESAGSITVTVESQGHPTADGWYSDNEWTVTNSGGALAGATSVGGGFSECAGSICLDHYEGRLLIPSASYFEFTIEAPDSDDDFEAEFAATGEAVESELICGSGPVGFGDYSEDDWPILKWMVDMTCEDDSFTVEVTSTVTEDGVEFHTEGTWALVDPSGSFDQYSGGGDLSTVCADGWCIDDYFGWLATG